jgi:hypothetical protein
MPDPMSAKAVRTHGQRTCTVEVSGEIDAGAAFTVTVRASCPDGCDLTGHGVSIRNQDGAELATDEFDGFDGQSYATSPFTLQAPLGVGEHIWRAVLAAQETDAVLHEATATEFSFTTKPHAMSVNVWGLPSAIAAGEGFGFKVGIKCSAACNLAGGPLRVHDNEGAEVGAARLRDDVWPGTAALYFAEMEARSPLTTGDHAWHVECPGSDSGVPHAAGASTFAVKVVSPPDHEVTVAAFDSETQTPIAGAHVLLHPYRALTDERGMAKVKVAKGRYQLFVSGFQYIAYQGIIDVTGDVTARAELSSEPEGQEDYR